MSDKSRAQKQAELLGQSFGSANFRLRKNIIFSLLEKHAENRCHVCGLWIDTVDEMTVEHIQPWENRSAELFWDLDNIAFSHVKCNKPHSYKGSDRRILSPKGQSWCPACQEHKDKSLFGLHGSRHDGTQTYCKECRKVIDKKYYQGSVAEQ